MYAKGLIRAKKIVESRQACADALRDEGKKVIGYLSVQVPLEIITALDMVPYRITGDIREPITEADRGLPAAFCPYMRSVLDASLKGRLNFLDGLAMNHPCDAQEKTVRVMSSLTKFPFTYFIDMPSTVHQYSVDYFAQQIADFKCSLEKFAGRSLTEAKLKQAIDAHNTQRALMRELYAFKKLEPPMISGSQTLEVVLAVQSLPVAEGNALLKEVIEEVKSGQAGGLKRKARVLVWGSVVDDVSYMDALEACGTNVVIDDLDEGMRAYCTDVDSGEKLPPFVQLATRYLTGVPAARTFVDAGDGAGKKDNIRDLQARYGYLGEYIEEYGVEGVILLLVRYCDPHGYELVDIMDYLKHLDMPHIYIEHNYSIGALAQIRTRVEAFSEILEY